MRAFRSKVKAALAKQGLITEITEDLAASTNVNAVRVPQPPAPEISNETPVDDWDKILEPVVTDESDQSVTDESEAAAAVVSQQVTFELCYKVLTHYKYHKNSSKFNIVQSSTYSHP